MVASAGRSFRRTRGIFRTHTTTFYDSMWYGNTKTLPSVQLEIELNEICTFLFLIKHVDNW